MPAPLPHPAAHPRHPARTSPVRTAAARTAPGRAASAALAVLLLAVAAVLAVLGPAGPAAAHGDSIHFDLSCLGDGHPRAVAAWDNDGDPVTETVAAELNAVASDGRTVGPWKLIAVPGAPATFTTAQALPPGQWKVSVESAFPALGRGEAELTVTAVPGDGAAPSPAASAPAATPSVAASAPAAGSTPASVASTPAARTVADPAPADRGWSGGALALALGCCAAVVGAVLLATRLLRRARG
ncbi:hypothetical protein GCM10009665_55510 [Kitasatospora nipponensis]|uniref:Uncharacterized protein n=1 Tax=Kitasatospora nipponensis TaxID=258049 RepID=A0ABP4HBL8_9ACTN